VTLEPRSDEELKAEALKKLKFMHQQYWRLRNGKARFMLCPYCSPLDQKFKRRNWPGKNFCCFTFRDAFAAILDRQEKVDEAYKAAQIATKLMKMVEN
jgi:hypothetical protein